MQMLKTLMTDYINSVVCEYFVNITAEQIQPQLQKGQFNLVNLQFKPEILKKFTLPFVISKSLIKSVIISFSNTYSVTIDSLNIVIEILNLEEKFFVESSLKLQILEKFKTTLIEGLLKAFGQEKQQQKQLDPKKKLALNIISSLELELNNISLTFVDKYCTKTQFGFSLSSLICKAAKQSDQNQKIRNIEITNLQIYWQENLTNLTCRASIQDNSNQDNQENMAYSIDVIVEELNFKCSKLQCSQIYQFADYVNRFQQKQDIAGKMPISKEKMQQQLQIKEILKKVPLTEQTINSLQEFEYQQLFLLFDTQSIQELKQIQFDILQHEKGEEIVQMRKKKLGWFGGMVKYDQKMSEKIVTLLNEFEQNPNFLANLIILFNLNIQNTQIELSSLYKKCLNKLIIGFNNISLKITKGDSIEVDFILHNGYVSLHSDRGINYIINKNEICQDSNIFELHFKDENQKESLNIATCPFQIVCDQSNFEQLYDLAYFFVISENQIPKLQKKAKLEIQNIANEKKSKNISIKLSKFYIISTNGQETFLFSPGLIEFNHQSNNEGKYNLIISDATLGFSEQIRSCIDFINQQFNFTSMIMKTKFQQITLFDLRAVISLQSNKIVTTLKLGDLQCQLNPEVYKYCHLFYHTHIQQPLQELKLQLKESEKKSLTTILFKKSDFEQWIKCNYSFKDSYITFYNVDEKLMKIDLKNQSFQAKEDQGLYLLELIVSKQIVILGFNQELERQVIIEKCTRNDDFFVQNIISNEQNIELETQFITQFSIQFDNFQLCLKDSKNKQFLQIKVEDFILQSEQIEKQSIIQISLKSVYVGDGDGLSNGFVNSILEIENSEKQQIYHQSIITNTESIIDIQIPNICLTYKTTYIALLLQFLTVQHQPNWDIRHLLINSYQKQYNTYLTMPDVQIKFSSNAINFNLIDEQSLMTICKFAVTDYKLKLRQLQSKLTLSMQSKNLDFFSFNMQQVPNTLLTLQDTKEAIQICVIEIDYIINDRLQRVVQQLKLDVPLKNVFINVDIQSILNIYSHLNFAFFYALQDPYSLSFGKFTINRKKQDNELIRQTQSQQDVKFQTIFNIGCQRLLLEQRYYSNPEKESTILIDCNNVCLTNIVTTQKSKCDIVSIHFKEVWLLLETGGGPKKKIANTSDFQVSFGSIANQASTMHIQFTTQKPLRIGISLNDVKDITQIVSKTILNQLLVLQITNANLLSYYFRDSQFNDIYIQDIRCITSLIKSSKFYADLEKVKIVVIDDYFSSSLPQFGIKLKNIQITIQLDENNSTVNMFNQLKLQNFHQSKLAWEPIIEPVQLCFSMDLNKKTQICQLKFDVLKDTNINISTGFISNLFKFKHIFRQFLAKDQLHIHNALRITYNSFEIANFSGTLLVAVGEDNQPFELQNGEKTLLASKGLYRFEIFGVNQTIRVENWSLLSQRKKVVNEKGFVLIFETIWDEFMKSSKTIISSNLVFVNLTNTIISLCFQNQQEVLLRNNTGKDKLLKTILNPNQNIIPNHLSKASFIIKQNNNQSNLLNMNELVNKKQFKDEFVQLGKNRFRIKCLPDSNLLQRTMIVLLPLYEFINQTPFQIEIIKVDEANKQTETRILLENEKFEDEESDSIKSCKYQFLIERYLISKQYSPIDFIKGFKFILQEEEWQLTFEKKLGFELNILPKIDEYGRNQLVIYINTPFIINNTNVDILIFQQGNEKQMQIASGQKYNTSQSIIPLKSFEEKDKIILGDRNSLSKSKAYTLNEIDQETIYLNRCEGDYNQLIPVIVKESIRQYGNLPLRLLEIHNKYLIINKTSDLEVTLLHQNINQAIIIKPQQQSSLIIWNTNLVNQEEKSYECSIRINNLKKITVSSTFNILKNAQYKIILRSVDCQQKEYLKISIYEAKTQQFMVIEDILDSSDYPYVIMNESKFLLVQLRLDNEVLKHNDRLFMAKNNFGNSEFIYPASVSVGNQVDSKTIDLKLDQVGMDGTFEIKKQKFFYFVKQIKDQKQFIFADEQPALRKSVGLTPQKKKVNLEINIKNQVFINYINNERNKSKELLIMAIQSILIKVMINSANSFEMKLKVSGLQLDSQTKKVSEMQTIFLQDQQSFEDSLECDFNLAYSTQNQACIDLIRIRPGHFQLCIDQRLLNTIQEIQAQVWNLQKIQQSICNISYQETHTIDDYHGIQQKNIIVRKLILEPLKIRVLYLQDTYEFSRQHYIQERVSCTSQELIEKIIRNYLIRGGSQFIFNIVGQFLSNKLLLNKVKISRVEKIREPRAFYQQNYLYRDFDFDDAIAYNQMKRYFKQHKQLLSHEAFLSSHKVLYKGQSKILIITENLLLLGEEEFMGAKEIQFHFQNPDCLLLQLILVNQEVLIYFSDLKQLNQASTNLERILS